MEQILLKWGSVHSFSVLDNQNTSAVRLCATLDCWMLPSPFLYEDEEELSANLLFFPPHSSGGACILWPGAVCGRNRRCNFHYVHHVSSKAFALFVVYSQIHLHTLSKFLDPVSPSFLVQSIDQLPFLRVAPLLPDPSCDLLHLLRGNTQLWVRHRCICDLTASFCDNSRSQ